MTSKHGPLLWALLLLGAAAPAQADSCVELLNHDDRCGTSVIASAAECGTKTVTSAAECGTKTVTSAAECGRRTVTSGALCGWEVVTGAVKCGVQCTGDFFTKLQTDCSCRVAQTCEIDNTCEIARTCQVAERCPVKNSCARLKPGCAVANLPSLDAGLAGKARGVLCNFVNKKGCGPMGYLDIVRNAEPFGQATCRAPDAMLEIKGCCGGPGVHGCIVATAAALSSPLGNLTKAVVGDGRLDPVCVGPSGNQLRLDGLCDLPPATCGPGIPEALAKDGKKDADFTFYATSDMHFYRKSFNLDDLVRHVREMNAMGPAQRSWRRFFGVAGMDDLAIAAPRALLVNGDFTLTARKEELAAYRLLYESGWTPESFQHPVFVGLGNHDVEKGYVDGQEAAQRLLDYQGAHMGCAGINRDAKSGAYSWNFGPVHFVQLNTYPRNAETKTLYPLYNASEADSISFLKKDLAKWVGKTGAPVVIAQHYQSGALNDDAMKILSQYNVIGLFDGDSHAGRVSYNGSIDDFTSSTGGSSGDRDLCEVVRSADGSYVARTRAASLPQPGEGSFLAARVSGNYLDVGHAYWRVGQDGVTTSVPNEAHVPYHNREDGTCFLSGYPEYYGDPSARGCRKRINSSFEEVPPSAVSISVANDVSLANFALRGRKKTITLTLVPGGKKVEGPLAVKFKGLCQAQGLVNRTFVDGCAVRSGNQDCKTAADTDISSPYLLLTDAQLKSLQAGSVSLSAEFAATPTLVAPDKKDIVKVVRLVPWKKP